MLTIAMPKCHICGKAGNYSQMIDYTIYSVHPQCEEKTKNNIIIDNLKSIYDHKKGLYSCPICKTNNNKEITKSELRKHLMNQHTKESLIDKVLLESFKTSNFKVGLQ
jgi:hypothetical protein